jgi:hypothetical protein
MSSTIGNIGSYDPTALYESLFKKIDSNSDDGVDEAEFESALSKMASDKNVSADEAKQMFATLDADGNGTIDTKEMMNALKDAGEQARASMPPPPPPPGGPQSQQDNLTDDQKKIGQTSESDLFSSLIESLKSSTTSSDDQITSIFNSLIQEMQNNAQYSQTGNVSYTTGNLSSLLSEYA